MFFQPTILIILAIAAPAFGIFWLWQFVQLMLLSDVDFPGRYDKPLWAATFLFVWPAAPFAFLAWKSGYLAMLNRDV